jgi:hypothetical protein
MQSNPQLVGAVAPRINEGAGVYVPLECGEIVYFPACPFPLAEGLDREFLRQQKLGNSLHKNISFDPVTGRTSGYRTISPEQESRLRALLVDFSVTATAWLAQWLPRYAGSWTLDRVHFRPEEEALRILREVARNELLHLDAFPTRPARGRRILRLFVNLNDHEPQTWVTSDTFGPLLQRYGRDVGLPANVEARWPRRLQQGLLGLIQSHRRQRTVYDRFMLRFHHFLKRHQEFQEKGPKRFWTFAPGSAWLLFTDGLSHGELRGQYALDHSYFISPESLALPDQSPAAILERACGVPDLRHAA